ncbi:MAG: Crp/Fnr family transcriptional regulator [Betaproteobacteria bacterium]|nr:Crp/Fnr family transcriptional regulator [Betaproteobacteria bacterium]
MKSPTVEALPPALLEQIAARAGARSFARNAVIVMEGDDTDALYVLLAGRARVFVSGEDGREMEVNRLGPGEYFGEVTLDGGPRSASVMALEDCRCAVVHRAELSRLFVEIPGFAEHMVRKLAHRVRVLTGNVRDLALMDVYGRVARLLLELAEDRDGRSIIAERITQKDIAHRVGASREMISRIFSDLSAGGYLRREGAQLVIERRLPPHW